jgi:hypothetical protein
MNSNSSKSQLGESATYPDTNSPAATPNPFKAIPLGVAFS